MRIGPAYLIVAIVVVCAAAGVGGYLASRGPTQPPPLQAQQEVIIGKFTPVSPPLPAPAMSYVAQDGKTTPLTSFAGRWVLVNLWATWCGPCIKEMPSLDRMQARLGSTLAVVAISEDRNGAKTVDPFVASLGLKSLTIGLDPKGDVGGDLHIVGLPTSILIDPKGRIVAKLEGATDWDSEPVFAALHRLMAAR